MRKFNIQNYVRYKDDVERTIKAVKKPVDALSDNYRRP
jgi:hypothetical protein